MQEEYENIDDDEILIAFPEFGSIDKLNSKNILDDTVFNHIFAIEDPIKRERELAKIQIKAKELKVAKQFNNMLKKYKSLYIKDMKDKSSNSTNFSNEKYTWEKNGKVANQLECGDWIANDNGVWKEEKKSTNSPTIIKASAIPIMPVERSINVDTGIEKVKIAFFKDGKWNEVIVDKNSIASKSKILQLANRGLEVTEENARNLINYLSDVIELNNFKPKHGVTHLGWINDKFVPYTNSHSYDGDNSYKKMYNSIQQKGNYEEWKQNIKILRNKNKSIRFLISASFASPLIKVFNINSFMVHLWGTSGKGKTVAQMVSASVWGNPAKGNLLATLNSTKVAAERMLNFLRNLPFIPDELQTIKSIYKDNYEDMIYNFTEGKGRDRGTTDGGLAENTEWDNITILSGEEPITANISAEGVKNRVIEIEENNEIVEDGNKVVNFILNNYGYAGKEFIEIVQSIGNDKLQELRCKYISELNKITKYKKQINAMSAILVADYIVSKHIFMEEPMNVSDVKDYFRDDTDEVDRIMQLLIDEFSVNANKFYKNRDDSERISGEIWGKVEKTSEDTRVLSYYVTQSKLIDILNKKGKSWNAIKKRMADKQYIDVRKYLFHGKDKIEYTVKENMIEGIRNVVKINVSKYYENSNIPTILDFTV